MHQANVSFMRIYISSLIACSVPKSKSVFGVFHLHLRPKHLNLSDSESEVPILIRSRQNLHFIFFMSFRGELLLRFVSLCCCLSALEPQHINGCVDISFGKVTFLKK